MTENLLQGETNSFDENKNWLEELVGEGKKFKTHEDLAKGKAYSDHYITTLVTERDTMREDYMKLKSEYEAGKKLQELIDERLAMQLQSSKDDTHNLNDVDTKPVNFDPKTIESLVSSKVQEIEANRREQENYNLVKAKVAEHYGQNFHSVLKAQAISLGLSDQEVDAMARRNPNLFFKTFDLNQAPRQENFQTPTTSSMRNDSFAPSGNTTARKKSYYEEMRRKDPDKYLSKATLVQMDKDVQTLGWDAFNDVR